MIFSKSMFAFASIFSLTILSATAIEYAASSNSHSSADISKKEYTSSTTRYVKREVSQSESFSLIAIRAGSTIQYDSIVINNSQLFLKGNGTDYVGFNGTVLTDGSLHILSDIAGGRIDNEAVITDLYLGVDSRTSNYVVQKEKDTSFAIKGGHLTYKLKDGAYAVPYRDPVYDFSYIIKFLSLDNDALPIALRTVNVTGGQPPDFP